MDWDMEKQMIDFSGLPRKGHGWIYLREEDLQGQLDTRKVDWWR